MYLNLAFSIQKGWKSFWVVLRDCWLDISTENGKEPFSSFHLGILKVRPCQEFQDYPNVLEFFDDEGFTDIRFYAFSYDPYDFLEFFKAICEIYKKWRNNLKDYPLPKGCQCEVKASTFLAPSIVWIVHPEKIILKKAGKDSSTILLQDIQQCNPSCTTSRIGYFKYVTKKPNSEPIESKCINLEQMKTLLDSIYTNKFLLLISSKKKKN